MKTEIRYTPGPWVLNIGDESEALIGDVDITTFDGRTNLARMARGDGAQEIADAKVMAAGPELLAALRFVVQCELDRDEESRNFENDSIEEFQRIISKAEGK